MRLEEQDRRVVFNTTSPSQQLQKFLFKQPANSASMEDVREIFSDLSKGAFRSLLYSARARGYITIGEDDVVRLQVDQSDIRTSIRDIVWKYIRILKNNFTVAQVCDDTGLKAKAVVEALRTFADQGLVVRSPKKVAMPTKYTLVSDSVSRPCDRRKSGSKATQVHEVLVHMKGEFSIGDLKDALAKAGVEVSNRYLRELLQSWRESGIVGVVNEDKGWGQRNVYTVLERKERPSVFRKGRRL